MEDCYIGNEILDNVLQPIYAILVGCTVQKSQ